MRGKVGAGIHGDQSGGDHPRTCGEKIRNLSLDAVGLGSPPHMRGKGRIGIDAVPIGGITPAHAGKRMDVGSA